MNISTESLVSEVVTMNYKTAAVFQSNNIDFCCGGNRPIGEACEDAGVSAEKLIREIEILVSSKDPDSEYVNNLSLTELSDHIVNRHHTFVQAAIPVLKQYLDKICKVHGDHHPELFEVRQLFLGSANDLSKHLQKEEIVLFPYIKKLESAKKTGMNTIRAPFGSVANPIAMMLTDHQNEGERYAKISQLTSNYTAPADGCITYEVTLKQLQDFENDLHRHIHLENNILFPKAMMLEN